MNKSLTTVSNYRQLSRKNGFITRKSITTNLLCAENIIVVATNNREPYDIITFDFSSAFDRISLYLLLQELAKHGITGSELKWFESFVSKWT